MPVAGDTVGNHITSQTRNLCSLAGIDATVPTQMISRLLGPVAFRSRNGPPLYHSDIADDATPLEFSLAIDDERLHLRVLGEAISSEPSPAANIAAAQGLLESLSTEHGLHLRRFEQIRDLFLPDMPQGKFAWWYSFIYQPSAPPTVKVYLNPAVRGQQKAPLLVKEAMDRLGLAGAYATLCQHALQRGGDAFAFFALDLDDAPTARVKIYIAHESADVSVAQRASGAVPDVDPGQVHGFLDLLAPDTTVFSGRPLLSSYSFVEGDTTPSNYSLYLPLRSYVPDDAVARDRVASWFARCGIDPGLLDRAIDAVTSRPLQGQRGLLAHVSLRLSGNRAGTTIYISSEAYGGTV